MHFQYYVELLYAELRNNIKAWLGDFNMFAKTEGELLDVIERLIELSSETIYFYE